MEIRTIQRLFFFIALANMTAISAHTAEIDFNRQIRPLLAKQCFACHGPDKRESGLGLHTFAMATAKLDSGIVAIDPGKSDSSELLSRISSDDPSVRMPPEGEGLTPRQIELIRQWIDSGAQYTEHWAFRELDRPAIPQSDSAGSLDWTASNPIDRFISAQWQNRGLQAAPPADPRSLIRRLYFDCIGVPPDLETLDQFVANPTEQAYLEIVDRLLADPRFGERAARNWLDVVRFAETNSYERDGAKPNAWKYRDYVIESFNEDKPYDQFLTEQIAGDELEQVTPETLTATGFFRLGIWDDEPADPLQARFDEYDDIVTTVGQGILGLTVNCARCHDHKIDPIPQKDYYQLVAFLRDVTSYGLRGDERSNSQIDVSDDSLKRQHAELKRSVVDNRRLIRVIEDAAIETLTGEDKVAATGPDRAKALQERLQGAVSPETWENYNRLKQQIEQAEQDIRALPIDYRLGLARTDRQPEGTHVLVRGSPQAPGELVEPGFLTLFQQERPEIPSSRNPATSGRRTVLARWLTSPDNRLTSRVIVNRIWQQHFGRGIVRSANNFGQMGDAPTHPELLDYLARELVAGGWSLKRLHRMLLTSATYRLSSIASNEQLERDPANDYFARFNARRLSAEEIRDASLVATGRINWRVSGPSMFPEVSNEVKAGQSVPGSGWGNSSEADRSRRSVYIYIKRSLVPPELSVFDFPDTDTSCEARFLTVQPAQALNLLNGSFNQRQASQLAERIEYELPSGSSLRDKLAALFLIAYSRHADAEELTRAQRRIAILESKFSLSETQAFREYCLVVLNSNEFIYVD